MTNRAWGIEESRELAELIYGGNSLKDAAQDMGWSYQAVKRHSKDKAVKRELFKLRDPGIPDQYYQGAVADKESECPYAWYETQDLCWWKAGFHDAARGYV